MATNNASRALCPVAAFHGRNRTVHIASFRAGHGDAASNYYHFFFGLLVPFLNWLETSRPLQGDAVSPQRAWYAHACKHKFLPQLMRLAGREKCVQVGVVGRRRATAATRRRATWRFPTISTGPSSRALRRGACARRVGPRLAPLRVRSLLDRGEAKRGAPRGASACASRERCCARARALLNHSCPRSRACSLCVDGPTRAIAHQNRSLPNFDALVAHLHAQSCGLLQSSSVSSTLQTRHSASKRQRDAPRKCGLGRPARGRTRPNAAYLRLTGGRAGRRRDLPKVHVVQVYLPVPRAGPAGRALWPHPADRQPRPRIGVAAVADAVAAVLEGAPARRSTKEIGIHHHAVAT